jgi:hypothetical protein
LIGFLSSNPKADDLLMTNQDINYWTYLSLNSHQYVVKLLESNIKKINWELLGYNHCSIDIFRKYPDKIIENIEQLQQNPYMFELLENNFDRITWSWGLSAKPNAIDLLKMNPEQIVWSGLSINPNAITMLETNFDKIDWNELSINPNALDVLKENPDKIQ